MPRPLALVVGFTLSLLCARPLQAHAEDALPSPAVSTSSTAFHADAEVDPLAYALQGYSLHVGIGYRRLRVDLGNYAMALPGFVHTNKGFDASFDGFGVKVQYFLFKEQEGGFIGVDGGLTRLLVEDKRSDAAARQNQLGVGVHVGWRFLLGKGFYATPWIGAGYAFNAENLHVGGRTYKNSAFTVFPAVHIGYRFR